MEEKNKIGVEKLRRIKQLSQLAAVVSLFVFLALIIYSARRLNKIYKDTAVASQELAGKQEELKKLEDKIAGLADRINKKNEQIEFQGDIIQRSPDVRESVKRADESNPRDDNVLPIIYLHIADESQQKRAKELANKLQEKGYIVPDIEDVSKKAGVKIPDQTVLRSFRLRREEDVSDILKILQSENVDVGNSDRSNLLTRKRQYEIFFSKNFK